MAQPVVTKEYFAAAAIPARTLVKLSNVNSIAAAAAATDLVIGVTESAIAAGAKGKVILSGIAECIAGAAFAVGVRLISDASGRVITATGAATARVEVVGYALQAAVGAGDVTEIAFAPSPWTVNTI